MRMTPIARQRVYRSVSTTRVALFCTVALVVFVAAAAMATPGRDQIAWSVGAVCLLVLTWRAWQWGVVVEDDGVKVVGSLISKRIAWDDIDRFEIRPFQQRPYTGYVAVRSRNRPIPIIAISAAGLPKRRDDCHRRQVQEPIDQLNEALEHWRTNHRQTA